MASFSGSKAMKLAHGSHSICENYLAMSVYYSNISAYFCVAARYFLTYLRVQDRDGCICVSCLWFSS